MTFKDRFGLSGMTMISVILGVFMAVLDSSVVNVAIPKMMSVFATDQSTIEWVVTGYMLTVGMLTPVSGYLADRFGAKTMYLFALAFFVAGSALCGAAWSASSIIVFRVIQAIGGALLMPISMTILFSLSKAEKRGFIMGLWGIAIMFAPAFGPTLSGYIVQYLDFRLIFYINVPIGIINLFIAEMFIPKLPARDAGKFDIPGFISSLVGFFCLLYALSDAPTSGWGSIKIISLFVVAGISLSLFVVFELTTERPMVDLRLFKIRAFLASNVAVSFMTLGMMGALFVLPVFLQNGIGLTPLQTGILTMPGALLTAALMPISGTLFDKIGARPLAFVGFTTMLVGSLLLINLNVNWSYFSIMAVYMVRQAGMGLSSMPLSTAGMNAVPPRQVNQASALQNTLRNVAGSMGAAVLGTVMQTHGSFSLATYMEHISVQSLQKISAYGLHPSVYGVTNQGDMLRLMGVLRQIAFQNGVREAFIIAAIVAAVALVSSLFIGKKQVHAASGEKHAVAVEF
ncbi:MAG: DHA2 family efflux MFS transporter permease subunit [Peptococcaceae bacterium]|nr:DHA2 family efflux MFS transporter permease subunit [Peptococcaceae bacterium]